MSDDHIRQSFEQWIKEDRGGVDTDLFEQDELGRYLDAWVNTLWIGYKAGWHRQGTLRSKA
jgi:hypothetical protein